MQEKAKLAVYTAIFGNYDDLLDPLYVSENVDYICFTDRRDFTSEIWDIRVIDSLGYSPPMANRHVKIMAHKYLQDYEYSLYVDGNIQLIGDPLSILTDDLDITGIMMPKHPSRDCIFEEAIECAALGRDSLNRIRWQIKRYINEGMPKKFGLGENSILLRRHVDLSVIKIMTAWWREINNESCRDQISLGYILWKNKIHFMYLSQGSRDNGPIFKFVHHKKDSETNIVKRILKYLNIRMRRLAIKFAGVS